MCWPSGEVGKVGVPISHLGDMRTLFDGIPLGQHEHLDDDQRPGGVAAVALYRRRPRSPGCRRAPSLQGTTQNDIIKEYLSRGTYIFPPEPSLRN
jgi:(2R)-ethylmalonyl-CoA mutase